MQGNFKSRRNESKYVRFLALSLLTSIYQGSKSVIIMIKVGKIAHFDHIGSIRQCMEPLRCREIAKIDEMSRNVRSLALSPLNKYL